MRFNAYWCTFLSSKMHKVSNTSPIIFVLSSCPVKFYLHAKFEHNPTNKVYPPSKAQAKIYIPKHITASKTYHDIFLIVYFKPILTANHGLLYRE